MEYCTNGIHVLYASVIFRVLVFLNNLNFCVNVSESQLRCNKNGIVCLMCWLQITGRSGRTGPASQGIA